MGKLASWKKLVLFYWAHLTLSSDECEWKGDCFYISSLEKCSPGSLKIPNSYFLKYL